MLDVGLGGAFFRCREHIPRFCLERALCGQGGGQGGGGAAEGCTEAILKRLEHHAAVGRNDLTDDAIVARTSLSHGLWELFPEPGAAGDVETQKGDRARRQVGDHIDLWWGLVDRFRALHTNKRSTTRRFPQILGFVNVFTVWGIGVVDERRRTRTCSFLS